MIREILFSRMALPDIRTGMDVSELRRQVGAEDIANALTPGYRPREVLFEDELRKAANGTRGQGLSLRATGTGHIGGPSRAVEPRVVPSEDPTLPNGTNAVDIEREMAELAWNRLQMSALTRFATRQYRLLNDAIGRSRS